METVSCRFQSLEQEPISYRLYLEQIKRELTLDADFVGLAFEEFATLEQGQKVRISIQPIFVLAATLQAFLHDVLLCRLCLLDLPFGAD